MTSSDSNKSFLATKKELLPVKQLAMQCIQYLKLDFSSIISRPTSRCDFPGVKKGVGKTVLGVDVGCLSRRLTALGWSFPLSCLSSLKHKIRS